jgi:hypothetical protein
MMQELLIQDSTCAIKDRFNTISLVKLNYKYMHRKIVKKEERDKILYLLQRNGLCLTS